MLGDLKKSDASYVFDGFKGANFALFASENAERISRQSPHCIGGFCFLHRGDICASGVSAEGRAMKVDLQGIPPKPFFDGGPEISKEILAKLGVADASTIGSWKLEVPGLEQKVSWGFMVKAMHYFEIARATANKQLTLIVPDYEYLSATVANASIFKIPAEESEKAIRNLGSKYDAFLTKLAKTFFSDVDLKTIRTTDQAFRRELAEFIGANLAIKETKIGSGDGFIGKSGNPDPKLCRELWKEESDSYLALFSYIFSSRRPTVFMLHGRDFVGYPLEGLEGASNQFDTKRIRENVAWLGVPSAPIITVRGNALPLLGKGGYGADTKKLSDILKNVPPTLDARFDDYFGLPGEHLTSDPLPENIGKHMLKPNGDCPFFIYVRNLLPYVDVPEDAMIKALNKCRSGQSHDGCRAVFIEAHRQVSQKLGC